VPRSRTVELYLHSLIYLHGILLYLTEVERRVYVFVNSFIGIKLGINILPYFMVKIENVEHLRPAIGKFR
jgi:hypothetical protein